MTTNFALKPRRDDPNAAIRVQQNLEQLRDAFDTFTGKYLGGNATVTNTNTTVVVTHGYGKTSYQISLTALGDPGGRVWVTGKTATQFTINLSAAAGVAGVPFDWAIKGV